MPKAKTAKFGGTSLADAAQFRKVERIIRADAERKFIVVSAPGKRTPDDQKLTDLLYLCHEHARQRIPFDDLWSRVAQRFTDIIAELKLDLDLTQELAEAAKQIARGTTADFAVSRGEYFSAKIMATLLGFEFVDAAETIFFNHEGHVDAQHTDAALSARLSKAGAAVVPGFYGTRTDGQIAAFSRGGSDVTGALVARAARASVYEKWTDVSGLLMADPRVVKDPQPIRRITYRELRELAYMGATVLHDEAIFPVRSAGIPVRIANTEAPEDPGSTILHDDAIGDEFIITGIAGRKDFTSILIEKALMNKELGFGRRVLSVLENNKISFEHMPSGIDVLSIVIRDSELTGKLDKVVAEIKGAVEPDRITVDPNLAVIAVVGRGMAKTPGVAGRIFSAMGRAGVNVRMIDQGSGELNLIVGVNCDEYEKTIRAVYDEFVGSPNGNLTPNPVKPSPVKQGC